MSGPIVRKYGFPNFEKIFGERPLKHGQEDEPAPPATAKEAAVTEAAKREAKPDERDETDRNRV